MKLPLLLALLLGTVSAFHLRTEMSNIESPLWDDTLPQLTCQRCYRGRLISIHNCSLNYQIQCLVKQINQGQVWIGGQVTGWGRCTRFRWLDGTPWNFAYWATGQPWGSAARCVTPCTRDMKYPLLLPLLLLGTVSSLYLENDASHLGSREADLSQDLEGSGEQEGELALNYGVLESEEEEAVASSYQDAFEGEEAMESDPAALDKDLQCPKEEDTVQLPGSPGCKTCRTLLVRTPKNFREAQNTCRKCYRGNLVSIHNYNFNYRIQCWVSRINQAWVWIGGFVRGRGNRFSWTDGSSWNFAYWAPGQPRSGRGRCVALSIRGGRWQRARCGSRLPFVCSF
ncbi:proteoglycan 3-like [Megaptera novaeangliae]